MSSSSPPVSSSAFSETLSVSSAYSHGSSAVSPLLRYDRGKGSSASNGVPIPSPSSAQFSAASLNPFAREFVPTAGASPPSEGRLARVDPSEWTTAFDSSINHPSSDQDGSERVSGAVLEGNHRIGQGSFQGSGSQRAGGLSATFKREQISQSRTPTVSKGGQGGTENTSGHVTAGGGKRGQFTNANHLLNFQYDPIVRAPPVPRFTPIRKLYKVQPYNRELFLQANFRFLVSDYGDYSLNSLDPDKMLQWEDIAAVNITAPIPVQCPICLEAPPICSQITSCGHIFCFSCILCYLVAGEEQQKSDHFKKCPLCFAMTSSRGLRTVLIDEVSNYRVGDYFELTLLNRAKGSMIPYERSEGVAGALPCSKDGKCHLFSKFTLTSDADPITNKAVVELTSWIERAQKEADEDMDLVPFALLAIDQLEQRKAAWMEHRLTEFLSSSPPVRDRIMAQSKEAQGSKSSARDVTAETEAAMAKKADWVYENAFSDDEASGLTPSRPTSSNNDGEVPIPSSWEDSIHEKPLGLEKAGSVSDAEKDSSPPQDIKKDDEDNECYAFYQCADGQPLLIHPLNMKCLLQHYGSYENLPARLQVKILEKEAQIQSEATRKRYRYLSHLPLTTNFWFCEVDLRGILPSSAFVPFIDELRSRETRRRRRLKQEQVARLRNEAVSAAQSSGSLPSESAPQSENEELLSGLTSEESSIEPVQSSMELADQRRLFSQVTRLGFASAHDAPDLVTPKKLEPLAIAHEKASSSGATSTKNPVTMSFADIIQSQPLKPMPSGPEAVTQSSSKKNKKATKILLSTAGGRRY